MKSVYLEAVLDTMADSPKMRVIAYTGGALRIRGFETAVYVDLDGLEFQQNLPVLFDHDRNCVVGHTEEIHLEDGNVVATVALSQQTWESENVFRTAKKDYPWQASIAGRIDDRAEIASGETMVVNGRTVTGPGVVVRKMTLREISFVVLGGDPNTSARLINGGEKNVMGADMSEEIMKDDAVKNDVEANAKDLMMDDYRKSVAAEIDRCEAIEQLRASADLKKEAIVGGWSVQEATLKAQEAELAQLRASRPAAGAMTAPANKKVLECLAMRAAGTASSTLEARYPEEVLEAADRRRGIGLREWLEAASGERLPGYRSDSAGYLRAAFSNADIPGLLSDVANKALLEGYAFADDSWRSVARITSVPDFKQAYRYRLDSDFTFSKVPAGGELKHGAISEGGYTNKAETYGVLFGIDRQMLVNDDLGALMEIPRQIGVAAAESVAEAVWGLLLSNPGNFFSATHNNFIAGADYALSIAGLNKAYATFAAQTKKNGKPLGAVPTLLVVPSCLAMSAEQLVKSITLNDGTAAPTGAANPFAGRFKVVASPYLDNASMTGYSATAWYLFADPVRVPTIEVSFLNGLDRPTVEQADADFNTLGIQFRGYVDYGVALGDWRGAVKVKGVN